MKKIYLNLALTLSCGIAVNLSLGSPQPGQDQLGSAAPSSVLVTNATREVALTKRFLLLPIKNGAPKRLATLTIDRQLLDQFEIELADAQPDWWAFVDVARFREKTANLTVDFLPTGSRGLELVEQADAIKGAEPLYRERFRPQFHFSSRRGWNNDPNGLVYDRGEYHLFYQHNPYGWNWGNMHWGHAVSRDLLHWRELPDALYPDRLGTMFSGSAVVDGANTAGFQQGDEPPMVCIYTAAGGTSQLSKGQRFTQCLAYSNDRGRSWTKFADNPVLPHLVGENRDPKVIWYEPQKKWVMALYLDHSDYTLLSSPNLKHWQQMGTVTIPGTSECPEFFAIPVRDQPAEKRWIFYGGNGRYLVGRFDGRQFVPESGPQNLNYGNCFYASQTYNHLPPKDGRRVLIPWGTVTMRDMPFNQMMGIPVELSLVRTEEGLRLFAQPISEIQSLRIRTQRAKPEAIEPGENPLEQITGELLDFETEIAMEQARELRIGLRGIQLLYDVKKMELTCQDKKAPLRLINGRIRLRVLVDRTSVEIFGNDGALYMPMAAVPNPENRSLELSVAGGAARLVNVAVHQLKSVW